MVVFNIYILPSYDSVHCGKKIPYMLSNSIFGKLVEYQMIGLKFFFVFRQSHMIFEMPGNQNDHLGILKPKGFFHLLNTVHCQN